MIVRFIKAMIKWPLISVTIGGLTYSYHNKIERIVNGVKFYDLKEEPGFIEKSRALKLGINYERNESGNLETYLIYSGVDIPIYQRKSRIILNDGNYNFGIFTEKEKINLCSRYGASKGRKTTASEKRLKARNFFSEMYDIVSD